MEIVELVLFIYFIYVVSYATIFSLGAALYRCRNFITEPSLKFCILIPAYKEDAVICETALHALSQPYPSDSFDVIVIADGLQPSTLTRLSKMPLRVIVVSFDKSTKVKALNAALSALPEKYDFAVVLDADNLMEKDFLWRMCCYLKSAGCLAVQGQRKPRNNGTSLEVLDGVSEAINNRIYRQGASALGLSASINGSGIAVGYRLLKEKLLRMNAIGGFDRELEILLLKDGLKVHYLKEAIVFDEKVSSVGSFRKQRRRWISSQYKYLIKYFGTGTKALLTGKIALFNSSILRNIQLPRLLNIGLLTLTTLALYPFKDTLPTGYWIWPALWFINTVVTLASVPAEFYSMKLVRAILFLPRAFVHLVRALISSKGADREFIHTPHRVKSYMND